MKYVLSMCCAFLMTIGIASAQKKFTEGTISYDISIRSGSGKADNADFMDGTMVINYVKGSRSRTEMISALGTQTTIYDSLKNNIIILKEFGEQKYMITLTQADWKDANRRYEGIVYSFDPSASKTILGYNCKKATGTLPDGTAYTVWYTPDLVPENKNFQYETKTLPGLALQYEISTPAQTITYSVSKISMSPVPVAKFDIPKSGYRVMTYAESKNLRN